MNNSIKNIQAALLSMQDETYHDFVAKLIPTVKYESIIGIRTPVLRAYAKEIEKDAQTDISEFLSSLPHQYFEENNLHAFIIELEKDFDKVIEKTENFLPYIDNWSTCDCFSPKVFKKHKTELLQYIDKWLNSDMIYTVRFGIKALMNFYLDEDFDEKYMQKVSNIISEEYYINMMVAWYFATALAKQYDCAVKYLENQVLPKWTHNKTIQKAIESYRITKEQKDYLRILKIKI